MASATESLKLQVLFDAIDKLSGPLRGMRGGTDRLSRALKASRDELRGFEAQQRKLDVLDKTTRDLAENSRALDTNRGKLRELRDALVAAENPSKNLREQYKAQLREIRQLERRNETLTRSQADVRRELERAGVPLNQLTQHQARLRSQMARANAAIDQQAARLERLRTAQRSYDRIMAVRGQIAGTGAGMIGGGVATGAPVLAAIKTYASFEDAMIGVAKQVQGSRDANGQLTASFRDLADQIQSMAEDPRIGLATTEVAALVEAGARMGIEGKDNLLAFARSAAYSAVAFDAMAGDIGESMARIAGLYKIPIKNIEQLGDTINWLDDQAQSKGADIIEVMSRIAGMSQTVGMSFNDAAALGSTFLSLGATAEVAATASNALIRELAVAANQPKRFQAALQSIGLSPDAVQAGMIKDSTGTILRVLDAIKSLPREQQLATTVGLFGKEYGDDVAKLADNMDEYRRQLGLANEEAARGSQLREAMNRADTVSARWQSLLSKLFNSSTDAGEKFRNTLMGLFDQADALVDTIHTWINDNPELVKWILIATGAVAALAVAGGSLMLAFSGFLGFIATAIIAIPVLKGVLIALTGPIGWAIAAVTAIGVAAYAIYDNWDRIKQAFVDVFKFIGDGIKRYFTDKLQWALDKLDAVKKFAGNAVDWAFGDDEPAAPTKPLRTRYASGNVTTTNHVAVTAAPGQSAEEVGKEVARQLDERDRRQGRARRSRYGDID